jgi:phosphotransferase system enzyme I (PtsP)
VAEFKKARSILDKELERHRKNKRPMPTDIKVGTMMEVPSLVWQLDHLLPLVDFISIGSNDLMQFFYASDRDNPKLNNRYDTIAPPALNMLKFIIEKCDHYNVPLTLCGEIGGKAIGALALIAIGFRRLSVAPAAIGPVKMMIRSLDLSTIEPFVDNLLSRSDQSVRHALEDFASANNIII